MQSYNPIRVWMRCDSCNHLYVEEFPEIKVEKSNNKDSSKIKNKGMLTDTRLFSYYSEILSRISSFTAGNELLEIGIGGCECALAAREMEYSVFGIDISEANVLQARSYGINAEQYDFHYFNMKQKWDVIILGDVIEHVSDPVSTMDKLYHLLDDNGVIWISTPNHEAAFSIVTGHSDPMRREGSHKNYFSRASLFKLLERFSFILLDYRISSHYSGSMEVIVAKNTFSLNFGG